MGTDRDAKARSTERVWAPGGPFSSLSAFVVVAGLLLGAQIGLALGGDNEVEWDSNLTSSLYRAVVLVAAGALLLRAVRVAENRLGWGLIAGGLVAWVVGDILVTAGIGDGWASGTCRVAFYASALSGLLVLARGEPVRPAAMLDGAIIMTGLVTVWTWLVLDHALDRRAAAGGELVGALTYPIFDLTLALVLVAVFLRHGWPRSGPWFLIGFAFALAAIADTISALESGGSLSRGTDPLLDAAWAAGAMLLGIAALTGPEPRAAPNDRVGREFSFALAVAFIALATLVLVAGRFEPIAIPTVVLAGITLLLGLARTVTVYLRRTRTESRLSSADVNEVQALARSVDARDPHTEGRSDRVALYSAAIAVRLGLDVGSVERVIIAAKLHDVGKVMVPDEILLKRGSLTPAELEAVRQHPVDGERIVAAAGFPDAARWIRHHHERWDGNGYPDGLSAGQIPLESRILAIADALEAMTTTRPYREAMSVEMASSELRSVAGSQFDPGIARVLVDLLRRRALRVDQGGRVPVASYAPDDASKHLGLSEYLRVEAMLSGAAAPADTPDRPHAQLVPAGAGHLAGQRGDR